VAQKSLDTAIPLFKKNQFSGGVCATLCMMELY